MASYLNDMKKKRTAPKLSVIKKISILSIDIKLLNDLAKPQKKH